MNMFDYYDSFSVSQTELCKCVAKWTKMNFRLLFEIIWSNFIENGEKQESNKYTNHMFCIESPKNLS